MRFGYSYVDQSHVRGLRSFPNGKPQDQKQHTSSDHGEWQSGCDKVTKVICHYCPATLRIKSKKRCRRLSIRCHKVRFSELSERCQQFAARMLAEMCKAESVAISTMGELSLSAFRARFQASFRVLRLTVYSMRSSAVRYLYCRTPASSRMPGTLALLRCNSLVDMRALLKHPAVV